MDAAFHGHCRCFDGDQMRTSRRDLSGLHFDFSKRKTRIEFNSLITQLSRLREAAEVGTSFLPVSMRAAVMAACQRIAGFWLSAARSQTSDMALFS